jgi:hypothetical protein
VAEPTSDRALRADLEQLQARSRALQVELTQEHAPAFLERRATVEIEAREAVSEDREEDVRAAPVLARQKELESRLAVARAEIAQFEQRQLSPQLILVPIAIAWMALSLGSRVFLEPGPASDFLGLLQSPLVSTVIGALGSFAVGIVISLRVGASVTERAPSASAVLLNTVVFNPAVWALPLVIGAWGGQAAIDLYLSDTPARLVELGWSEASALIAVALAIWGSFFRRGLARWQSIIVGVLGGGALLAGMLRGPSAARGSGLLLLASAVPMLAPVSWVLLSWLRGFGRLRAAWLAPALVSVLASVVLSLNGPSADERRLQIPSQAIAAAAGEGVLSPRLVLHREATLVWFNQRLALGAVTTPGLVDARALDTQLKADHELRGEILGAHLLDLALFLLALQLALVALVGAFLFAADEPRVWRTRAALLIPFGVLLMVTLLRS